MLIKVFIHKEKIRQHQDTDQGTNQGQSLR